MNKYISTILKTIGFLLIHYILYGIFNVIVGIIVRSDTIPSEYLQNVPMVMAAIAAVLIARRTLYIKFNKEELRRFIWGISRGFIFSFIVIIVFFISGQGTLSSSITNTFVKENSLINILFLALNLLMFTFGEEIIFRGVVFNNFKNIVSMRGIIITTSLLNSLWIIYLFSATPISIFNKFLYAVILAIFIWKNYNLEYTIGFGFALRFLFMLLINPKGFELLSGGKIGVFGGLLFTILAMAYLYYLKIKEEMTIRFSIKSLIASSTAVVLVISYCALDISAWSAPKTSFDTTPVKTVPHYENVNDYILDLSLDPKLNKLYGTQEVSYINNSGDNLKEVYFHNYAAAFKEYKGDIQIHKVEVDNNSSTFSIEGEDKTLLKVELKDELKHSKRVNIRIEYTIDIPKSRNDGFADRFGYGPNTINLGNFFPITAVYEDGKWDTHLYDKKGDAFYSETSNLNVKIKAPKKYELAVTGDVTDIQEDGNNKIWSITANAVRDFAVVASDKFQVVEGNVDGTIVKAYAFNKYKAQKVLDISAQSIRIFNNRFGKYPYGTCSIVQSDLQGGMEYPTLVMISSDSYENIGINNVMNSFVYKDIIGELETVVVHELAHQWWYGLVGNDEFNEAWVDEPLTQFSTLIYYKDRYGEEYFNDMYNSSIARIYNLSFAFIKADSFKRPLNEFREDEYTGLIYFKVPMLIKEQYDAIGDEKFNEIFRGIFEKYKFKVLKGEDFPLELDVSK